jgi:hypothetical protein
MNIDLKLLEAKLREMHPESKQHDLALSLCFDDKKDAWIVQLSKGKRV